MFLTGACVQSFVSFESASAVSETKNRFFKIILFTHCCIILFRHLKGEKHKHQDATYKNKTQICCCRLAEEIYQDD